MLFELRQYKIQPGRMDDWVAFMEEVVIPFQVAQGMVILGSFRGEADPDTYVWIRRFADEEERARLYPAVYQSDTWREKMAPKVAEMLIREEIRVTRLTPTPRSPIQ
jgi:hypothetical protein